MKKRVCLVSLWSLLMAGCASVQGPPRILNAQGAVPGPQQGNDNAPANLEENFRTAAEAAFGTVAPAASASAAQANELATEASAPPTEAVIDEFMRSGFALVYARCNDYFWRMGQNQTRARVARDAIAPIVSLLTGVIALRDFSNANREQELLQMLSLGSAFSTSSLDIYDTHFLFGAENINSVRVLTFNALATHRTGVEGLTVTTPEAAAIHLIDHQAICTPPNILALARDAIAKGEVEQTIAGGGGARRDQDWRRSIANELGQPGTITAEQVFALWWLLSQDGASGELARIKALLGNMPADLSPLEETGDPPVVSAKAEWSHRDDILRLLDSIPPATRAAYVARLAAERQNLAAPATNVDALTESVNFLARWPASRLPLPSLVPIESGNSFQRVGVRIRN